MHYINNILYIFSAFVGLDNKLYKMHSAYIKNIKLFYGILC